MSAFRLIYPNYPLDNLIILWFNQKIENNPIFDIKREVFMRTLSEIMQDQADAMMQHIESLLDKDFDEIETLELQNYAPIKTDKE
jgi:hypothetical protein